MAIIVNRNTTQAPMIPVGRTGSQSLIFIPAPRVYVKTPDSRSAAPVQAYFTKSNGVTPTGWVDLGLISGDLTINYEQKTKEIRTGIDNILRAAYLEQKGATLEAMLGQVDDVTLETVSGLTASVIVPGSVVNYSVGSTDMNQLAMLFVVQNKLDGKEFQYYNPNAFISFEFTKGSNGDTVLKMSGILPAFTAQAASTEQFLATTIFA